MRDVRPAAVAGTWYPGTQAPLTIALEEYLGEADVPATPRLTAVVAPHAGLMYSGSVASYAYKAARAGGSRYGTVVLVGPSHYVRFEGISIWARGAWETPLGRLPIDAELADRIAAEYPGIAHDRTVHGREHSLELQTPFIAHLMPGTRIVPLLMGDQSRDSAFALADAMARAVAHRSGAAGDAQDVLLVASSDLSHYEDAATASRMDSVVLTQVEALDAEGLMDALERDPRHACGGGAIVSVLRASAAAGASHARVLRHADSGDVSGDKTSVVGYMAAAIW